MGNHERICYVDLTVDEIAVHVVPVKPFMRMNDTHEDFAHTTVKQRRHIEDIFEML